MRSRQDSAFVVKPSSERSNVSGLHPLPRVCRVVTLPAPNDRERTQWYFQRYVTHLPAAGELVLLDLESRSRWEAYTKAKESMLERTHIAEAPWWVVHAVDKKKSRLNCIHHLLSQVPYEAVVKPAIELRKRVRHPDYSRHPVPAQMMAPQVY